MSDSEFLNWMANRLVNKYGESPNTDFVLKLRDMAKKIVEYEELNKKSRNLVNLLEKSSFLQDFPC